jgi:hypothetical protein
MGRVCLVVAGLAIALGAVAPAAATQRFPLGKLTGSVTSATDPAQHYAVYLPSSYDDKKPAPVLFIMDYRGRARVAADVFVPAAERFGWILISSNQTGSDESAQPSLVALKAMWTDAHDLFSIDERRLYVAGLSGTARTSTYVATELPGRFAGVIGAAAGFRPGTALTTPPPFLYFGTVGDVDYNYWEMRDLDRKLGDLGAPYRMEFFSGPHGWMPPSLAMAAVEWMELRAMQAKLRSADAALLDAMWWRDLQAAEMIEEAGRLPVAARRFAAMARDYDGLRPADDLAMVKARSASLDAEPRLAIVADNEKASAAAHAQQIASAMKAIARAFPVGAGAPARPLASAIDDVGIPALLATAAGRDQSAALDARRVLAELDVQTGFYLPLDALEHDDDARAMYYLDLAQAINATDPFAWFLRAKVHARGHRSADAFAALERAVALGFRTVSALEQDKAFAQLRSQPEFATLVDRVRLAWER